MKLTQMITDRIIQIAGKGNVLFHEKMKDHTTMKVGGEAALFVTPESTDAVKDLVRLLREEQIPYYVLGNGSNVICRDEGYDGVILCLSVKYKGFDIQDTDSETAGWYTLDGRRISRQPNQPGIYLHNGRKTVLK